MNIRQASELQKLGEEIDVKVVPIEMGNEFGVRFRDVELSSFTRAALHLKHIQVSELPENHEHLIG